jgi:hypothetical protein
LLGCLQTGFVKPDSLHQVWIGEERFAQQHTGPWQDVLRRERMPFVPWLMSQIADETELSEIASLMIEVGGRLRYGKRIEGDDLSAALKYADHDPILEARSDLIRRAHAEWERYTSS